jgi:hypothetical protein
MGSLKLAVKPLVRTDWLSVEMTLPLSRVTDVICGASVSMLKALTLRLSLVFPAGSVTVMLQLL